MSLSIDVEAWRRHHSQLVWLSGCSSLLLNLLCRYQPELHLGLSSSHMRFMSSHWSATKQRLYPQSVAAISRHSVLSGDRIQQCETSWWNVTTVCFVSRLCVAVKCIADSFTQMSWAEPRVIGRWPGWLTIVLQCYDTVSWSSVP